MRRTAAEQNAPDAPRSWLRDRRGCFWVIVGEVVALAVIVWACVIHLRGG